jgi:carboxymethylenebutenolidase
MYQKSREIIILKKLAILVTLLMGYSLTLGAQTKPEAPGRRNVTFPAADSSTLSGYLAVPPGPGPFPAVILIHEWWGLNEDTTILADALSKEGFLVLAADAFRGKVAQEASEARKQIQDTPPAQIDSDLDAAYRFLVQHPKVRMDAIASWGFCFGGTQSMRMGARNPGLAAVVIFYGGGPFQKPEDLGKMDTVKAVLGIYGEKDTGIPLEQVRNFEQALNVRKIQNTITVYPEMGHAFVKSTTYNKGGAPEKAWKQAVAFLKEILK